MEQSNITKAHNKLQTLLTLISGVINILTALDAHTNVHLLNSAKTVFPIPIHFGTHMQKLRHLDGQLINQNVHLVPQSKMNLQNDIHIHRDTFRSL